MLKTKAELRKLLNVPYKRVLVTAEDIDEGTRMLRAMMPNEDAVDTALRPYLIGAAMRSEPISGMEHNTFCKMYAEKGGLVVSVEVCVHNYDVLSDQRCDQCKLELAQYRVEPLGLNDDMRLCVSCTNGFVGHAVISALPKGPTPSSVATKMQEPPKCMRCFDRTATCAVEPDGGHQTFRLCDDCTKIWVGRGTIRTLFSQHPVWGKVNERHAGETIEAHPHVDDLPTLPTLQDAFEVPHE